MSVSCGREKKTKPPKCFLPCKIPSKCHHPNAHNCHMYECPPCIEQCLLMNDTTNCDHPCTAKCHDAVKVQIIDKNFKPAGPWDIQPEKYEIRKLPHPRCEIQVPVDCIGGHETALWPCWNSNPSSCGRICGRALKCSNHVCESLCHSVEDKTSMTVEILFTLSFCFGLFSVQSKNTFIFSCSEINLVLSVSRVVRYQDQLVVFMLVKKDVTQNHVVHVQ